MRGHVDPERQVLLDPDDLPTAWYNIVPDLPEPLPPMLDGKTLKPVGAKEMEHIFPREIVRLQFSMQARESIPEEVRDAYLRIHRPSPLLRARHLEQFLKTPAQIWCKAEYLTPPGSMKTNTALPQAYYTRREGIEKIVTETGAGQWGSACAMSCAFFDLDCRIYMVRVSYLQKPGRRVMMETWGAEVIPSPSDRTEIGRSYLRQNPEHPGSLGIAISEAVETLKHDAGFKYNLASVFNWALTHQSIIGVEAKEQFARLDRYPDVMTGCIGGGSNFAGLTYAFMQDRLKGKTDTEFVAVEPKAVPSTTRGQYTYDYGDTAESTPLIKMHTVGHRYAPPPIHAGGLRYHGKAPSLCMLIDKGYVRSVSYHQTEVFEAARIFAQTEGMLTAPESAHGLRYAMDEALRCKRTGEKKIIVFNDCGHGLLDLQAYDEFLKGTLVDWEPEHVEIPQYVPARTQRLRSANRTRR